MRIVGAVVVSLLLCSAVWAQEQPYEMVLAPFDTMSFGGLLGSQWSAELWIRNDSDRSVNLAPERCYWLGRAEPCTFRYEVQPFTTVLANIANTTADQPGVFLYVPTDRIEQIHFNLRIRDLARAGDSYGTEVPVVRLRDFRTRRATLLNVPLQFGSRLGLRVYLAGHTSFSEFVVRLYSDPSGFLLAERRFQQVLPPDPPSSLLWAPSMNLSSAFGGLIADRVRVVIEQTQPGGLPFWPLLTITNNRTQAVTLVTPQ